jgi:lysine-specific permease
MVEISIQTWMGVDFVPNVDLGLNANATKTVAKDKLHRSLKSRHLSIIAIGGAIGTGLFVASGASISSAGPGGALLAYIVIGLMVYFVMTGLGEMATLLPTTGSFASYAAKFVDPALGFSIGWNYWLSWAVTIPAELSAGALVMQYWYPNSPAILWSAIFLVILFALNILSTRGYGESEYWFAGIKVVTIVVFIVVGIAMILGILTHPAVGFHNFVLGGSPFHGGFMAVFGVAMIAGFSFQGTEIVGIAAGESDNPTRNVPRAINTVFWRILIFYVLSILIIGLIIPYTDPNLLKNGVSDVAVSPFTLVFQRAGLALAAALMNAVILTSVLSCGNSSMYASTRMLWALAKEGRAPKIFTKLNARGVPSYALYLTTIFGFLAFLASLPQVGNGVVYIWLLNCSGMTGFITWLGISICHYRFRKAYVAQGKSLSDLTYRARWYPFGPIFAFIVCAIVIVFQGYGSFLSGGPIQWGNVIATYIGIPVFIVLWVLYKVIRKTRVVPLNECSFEVEKA